LTPIRYVGTLKGDLGLPRAIADPRTNATMNGSISYLVGAIMGTALQLPSRRRQREHRRLEDRDQPVGWRLTPRTRAACSFLRGAPERHAPTCSAADRVFSTQFSNCRRTKDLSVLNWDVRRETTKIHGVTYLSAVVCAITTVLGEIDLAVVNGGYGEPQAIMLPPGPPRGARRSRLRALAPRGPGKFSSAARLTATLAAQAARPDLTAVRFISRRPARAQDSTPLAFPSHTERKNACTRKFLRTLAGLLHAIGYPKRGDLSFPRMLSCEFDHFLGRLRATS
jgi:hypothetical protein